MDGFQRFSRYSATPPYTAQYSGLRHETIPKSRPSTNNIPPILRPWAVVLAISSMAILALAIEVAVFFSQRNGGFPMNQDTQRVQWLTGFLPTLAISPLVWMWRRMDVDLKRMQPYVVLSRGPASAEKSILMDLEHPNLFQTLRIALRNGYTLVVGSTIIVFLSVFFHPFAGSFFLVKQSMTMYTSNDFAHSTSAVGLNPAYKDITPFVAAAGYTDAAAFHNLSDPPFVKGSWAVTEFKFPFDTTRNSTVAVRVPAVQTNVSCTGSGTFQLIRPATSTSHNWTLTASLPARGPACTVTQSIDSTVALSQYGVEAVPGCADNAASQPAPFAPVIFWYFSTLPSGECVGSAVFCTPAIAVSEVEAVVDGRTGLLISVNTTSDVDHNVISNNITGGASGFAPKVFNGISFDSPDDFNLTDPFVRARALAVKSGLPGTILRFAADPQQSGGLNAVYADPDGFSNLTQKIYTRYMSIVARSNYFVPANEPMQTEVRIWPNRLWINPVTAQSMVILLLTVAVLGGIIHFCHMRQRKGLFLASPPGSMAHYLSILSDPQLAPLTLREPAGGSTMVGPLDSTRSIQQKLWGVQFAIDPRTGGVVPVYSAARRESHMPPVEPRLRRARPRSDSTYGSSSYGDTTEYEMEDPTKVQLGPEYVTEPYRDPFDDKKIHPFWNS